MNFKEVLDRLQLYVDTEMKIMAHLGRNHTIDHIELDWATAFNLGMLATMKTDSRIRIRPRFGNNKPEYTGYTFLSYRVLSDHENFEMSFMTIHFNNGVTSKLLFGKEEK